MTFFFSRPYIISRSPWYDITLCTLQVCELRVYIYYVCGFSTQKPFFLPVDIQHTQCQRVLVPILHPQRDACSVCRSCLFKGTPSATRRPRRNKNRIHYYLRNKYSVPRTVFFSWIVPGIEVQWLIQKWATEKGICNFGRGKVDHVIRWSNWKVWATISGVSSDLRSTIYVWDRNDPNKCKFWSQFLDKAVLYVQRECDVVPGMSQEARMYVLPRSRHSSSIEEYVLVLQPRLCSLKLSSNGVLQPRGSLLKKLNFSREAWINEVSAVKKSGR